MLYIIAFIEDTMQFNHLTESVIFSRPAHLINRASRLFIRVGDRRLGLLGFSAGQLPILVALKDGKRLSQKELARLARIEQPTMAQTLSRMERDGVIQRLPDAFDRRSSLVSLTPAATEKMAQVLEVLLQGNEEALQGFNDAEKEALTNLLRRVISNLETMADRKDQ